MPNNWKTYKLSEITNVITKGTTPSTYGFGFIDKGINFIKSESTNYDGRLDETVFVKVSEEAHNKLKRSQLEEDDILFSMAGAYLGKTGIVYKKHLPANTNQANGIIRVNKNKAFPKFVSFLLRNPSLIRYVNASAGQSAQPNINLADIGGLEFKLPPIEEQQSIASILSAIDDKIENNLAINKTLEEMAMVLYKHWFVDFGPFQDGEFVESELGMIPKDWEVKKLDELAEILNAKRVPLSTNQRSKRKGKYPYYGASGVIDYIDDYVFDGEYILISEDGENLRSRSTPIAFSAFGQFWVNNHAHILKEKEIGYNYLIICHFSQLDMNPYLTGAVQPKLNKQNLLQIGIPLPMNIKLAKEVFNKFEHYSSQIISNIKENQTLTQLRDAILPQLISGEVRLKEFWETIKEVV